ncbi:MAG: hypothetical protein GY717_13900 [Rhodobacteraceae bacterium]|nr:hypothetical protein [Paracoccaceae bacterium]
MIRAPHIENHNLSRTLHRQRTNRHAQIQISEGRKLLKPTGRDAYRQKVRKTHDGFARTSLTNPTMPNAWRVTQ